MAKGNNNLGPISMAVALHAVLLGSMLVAFDFARPAPPITPLAIHATLVPENEEIPPRPERVPEPEVKPPEPDPEPDNSEQLRRQEEEEKRVQDALIEKQRLEKIRLQDALIEKQRLEKIRLQEEADKQRKQREDDARKKREEDERKKREEADKEKRRIEAERERQENEQRQRDENDRLRRELEADQREQELDDETRRMAADSSPAMAAYQFAISQEIRRHWSVPASANADTLCVVRLRQDTAGYILDFNIISCNGDDAVHRSIDAAIGKSSPLPLPPNPDVFRAKIELNLRPES